MPYQDLVAGLAGAALVLIIVWDAFETVLVPRRIGRRVRLTRYFYLVTWRVWHALAGRVGHAVRREGLLGFYGPLSLILLLLCWASGLIVGFALLMFASGSRSVHSAADCGLILYMSGETFFTLGYGDFTPATTLGRVLAVFEAGLGFGFLGTVVGYLPTLYGAFAQREIEISLMDARAGSPPTAAEFLRRTSHSGDLDLGDDLLAAWERWSAQLLETHISYPQLAYYRSQHRNQSWLSALTTILDTTSLILARAGAEARPQAQLTFAMARHALVDITQIFVPRYPGPGPERLTAERLALLRARLASTPMELPASDEFTPRLAELRLQYEPYAQALAEYLRFELPEWVHEQPRRDNWQGGPWDRLLRAQHAHGHRSDEHF
ncbi:MAG: potassium channel family protein [Candidatus Eisenbacteria bacterium]